MKKNIITAGIITIFIMLLMGAGYYGIEKIFSHHREEMKSIIGSGKSDTVHVNQVSPPIVINNHIPYKVEVQKAPDTVYRERMEKGTLVAGVAISGNKEEITKIDTNGTLTKETHDIPDGSSIVIDSKGNTEITQDKKKIRKEKRKKILRGAGTITIAIVSFIAGIKLF